jgi:hypothetical protein
MTKKDTRVLAMAWLLDAAGSEPVLVEGHYAAPYAISADTERACIDRIPPRLRRRLPIRAADPQSAAFVARGRALLGCGRRGKAEQWSELDPRCWVVVGRMSPGEPACETRLDPFDAFYVPFTGGGYERPGPEIEVLRRTCDR